MYATLHDIRWVQIHIATGSFASHMLEEMVYNALGDEALGS